MSTWKHMDETIKIGEDGRFRIVGDESMGSVFGSLTEAKAHIEKDAATKRKQATVNLNLPVVIYARKGEVRHATLRGIHRGTRQLIFEGFKGSGYDTPVVLPVEGESLLREWVRAQKAEDVLRRVAEELRLGTDGYGRLTDEQYDKAIAALQEQCAKAQRELAVAEEASND